MNRQYMTDYRRAHDISLSEMAGECRCSQTLLEMLESWDGEVTHPHIAERIARAYHLTRSQHRSLLPANHRPGRGYDPDRYKIDVEFGNSLTTRCL